MDPYEERRERDERYTRRVELRRRLDQRSGNNIARGV